MDNFSGLLQKLYFSTGEVTACDLNVNYLLAVALSDKTVRVLEWKTGLGFVDVFYSPLSHHKYKITSVKFSPKGTMLVSASLDGTAILLDALRGTKIFTMVQHNRSSIKFCQFTFDCSKILTAADDNVLCFWDIFHQRQLRHFHFHEIEYNLKSLTFSPDSEYIISIDSTDLLKLWFIGDINNNLPQCILMKRDVHDENCCCEFSPVKNILDDIFLKFTYSIVTCGGDALIKVWDLTIEKKQITENNQRFKCELKLVNILKDATDIISTKYDPSGKFIVSIGLDNLIKLWEVNTGKCIKIFRGHTKMVTCAAFSKNSALLATGSNDKNLIIWDLTENLSLDLQLLTPCNVSSHFTHIDLTNYVFEKMETNKIQKLEFVLTQKLSFSSIIKCVQFQNKHTLAIAVGKTVAFWKKDNNTLLFKKKLTSKKYKYSFNCLDISPCGSKIIFCSIDGVIILWDLNMNLSFEMKTPSCTASLKNCKFLPDSKHIAAAGDDQKVYLWDSNNVKFIKVLQQHENAVTALAFTHDSKYLVSTCNGGHIVLQNLDRETCTDRIENAHDLGVTTCDFFPTEIPDYYARTHFFNLKQNCNDTYILATGGRDSNVKLWEVGESKIFISKVFSGHGGTINCVKFSPSEPFFLASCSSDTTVRIWEMNSEQCIQVLNIHKSDVTTCSFSSSSDVLATGSLDKTVLFFEISSHFNSEFEEEISRNNKLLENWTISDTSNWFLELGWKEAAEKIFAMKLDGRGLLTDANDSIMDNIKLESEDDRKTLKLLLFGLKKQFLRFSVDLQYKEKSIPHMFLCPITHEIMKEPVICSDGFIYEKAALTEWFLSRKFISPVTKEYLRSTKFLSYSALKINIYKFLYENKN